MATYAELFELRSNSSLQNRVAVAVAVAAQTILAGSPTAEQAAWAKSTSADPMSSAMEVINLVLAANKAQTSAAILSATDAAIQTNVDAVVNGLILGG